MPTGDESFAQSLTAYDLPPTEKELTRDPVFLFLGAPSPDNQNTSIDSPHQLQPDKEESLCSRNLF
jgi:hypothetical protein